MPDFTEPSAIRDAYAGARTRLIADGPSRRRRAVAGLGAGMSGLDRTRRAGPPRGQHHRCLGRSAERSAVGGDDRRPGGRSSRLCRPSAVADEWEANAEGIDGLIDSMGMAVFTIAMDAITHEGDIRGALVESRVPAEAVAFHHHFGAEGFASRVTEHGLAAVEITADGETTVAGAGDPAITLRAGRYDLSRAFLGRRSASQVREFTLVGRSRPVRRDLRRLRPGRRPGGGLSPDGPHRPRTAPRRR